MSGLQDWLLDRSVVTTISILNVFQQTTLVQQEGIKWGIYPFWYRR